MKNIKFILAAFVSLAVLSCVELESPVTTPETNQDSGLVTLTLSTGEATKTHIVDGTEIYWDEGDALAVFTDEMYGYEIFGIGYETNTFSFPMSGNPNGNFASFSGSIAKGTENIWAVYPESSAKSCSDDGNGSDIVASLPSEQRPVAKSFDTNLNISVAKSKVTKNGSMGQYELTETIFVNFKNVCSLLKFTAPENAGDIESVVISANRDIVGDMTIDYSGAEPTVTDVSGSNSVIMTGEFEPNKDYYFVLAPVAISELTIYVNTTDKKQYSSTKTFGNDTPYQLQAGQYKSLGKVDFINKMKSFEIGYDIKDDNNFLNGTDLILKFPSDDVSSIALTVSQKGGSAKRTINVSKPVIDPTGKYTAEYSNDTDWPYLPMGTYTVSGTYETEGGSVNVAAEFTIDASPIFTIGSFKAFTSYTKYAAGAITDANACDGTSIYIDQIGGISENIYRNGNYAACFEAKFNGSENQITASYHSEVGKNRFSMPAYGKYTSAVVTFDGVASSAVSIDCHVTGIPYALDKKSNDSLNPWSTDGDGDVLSWVGGDGMVVGVLVGQMNVSKKFHIPSNINVSVSTEGSFYNSIIFTNRTGSVTVGNTEVVKTTVSAYKTGSLTKTNVNATFTEQSPMAKVHYSEASITALYLKKLIINYR